MKLKLTIFFVFLFLALGYAGHVDKQEEILKQADVTCAQQDTYTTPTYDQCISNQLENNNDK